MLAARSAFLVTKIAEHVDHSSWRLVALSNERLGSVSLES